jgi:type III secretory pathway lipoprotein EscJ
MKDVAILVCLLMIFALTNCSKSTSQVVEVKSFPTDNLEGIITQSGVEIDKTVSSDGKGSLRISVSEPTVRNMSMTLRHSSSAFSVFFPQSLAITSAC